jgi:hypothetical protein
MTTDEKLIKIKSILLEDWDPIGVKGLDGAKDEYDSYAVEILQMIDAGENEKNIFAYLRKMETVHMGLPGNESAVEMVAKKISSL